MFIADGRRTGLGRFLGLRFVLGFCFSFCPLGLALGLLSCPAFMVLSDLLSAWFESGAIVFTNTSHELPTSDTIGPTTDVTSHSLIWRHQMAEFEGILPAIATPMGTDGRFNEAAFREVMEFNIQAGVHGFWVAGGTGESVLLDDDENMAIARAAADQNRGRIKNIMHVGAPTTLRAARMAENAAAAGVEAICCVPPFFYRQSDDSIVEHYRTVAAAADVPLFLYNLPQSTGVEITPELMAKIQEGVPQLKGLKHSSVNFTNVYNWVDMGLDCLIGSSALMLPALTIGASGCVDGPPNIAPELWVEIWRAYRSGDLARAEKAQRRATRLTMVVREFGMHAVIKALLSYRLGIDVGDPRLPTKPLTPGQRDQVIATAEAIGVGRVAVAQSDD